MLDMLFVIIYFIFPLLALLYIKYIGLNIFTISISTILIISLFIYSYIGIFPLYFYLDKYRYGMGVQDRTIMFEMLCYSIISITGVLSGITCAKSILKKRSVKKYSTT